MKRFLSKSASWLIGVTFLVVRKTCRFQYHNDPRAALQGDGRPHVFALLHAQQVAATMAADPGTAAMVSRSADGEIIARFLRLAGMVPIRGSSGMSKGGATALQGMIAHVRGNHPATVAVDGPRGPRGSVKAGVAMLAAKSGAAVLPVMAIPSRRWILSRTWDRLQIPKPFSTIRCYVAEPMLPQPTESPAQFARRIEQSLAALEEEFDPVEAASMRHAASPDSERVAA